MSAFRPLQTYTPAQIESFVREVFAEQADALVLKSNAPRLKTMSDFLQRVEIVERPDLKGKKFPPLASVALLNKYNPQLRRDDAYDAATFNPLKYAFPMASRNTEIFRFGSSDCLIIIHPVK